MFFLHWECSCAIIPIVCIAVIKRFLTGEAGAIPARSRRCIKAAPLSQLTGITVAHCPRGMDRVDIILLSMGRMFS